ncbi:hypothetical protein VTL71DRAFT_13057 [Oculimacula yallundae]|uniref:Beta-lactamase-related domain-containing protein n=1 Tax=Oculimacula yallundae TaxID=86028 RepID=A0ABR4CQI3_9HELO
MASLEQKFEEACDARDIPGVVLLASNGKGGFKYEKAFGPRNDLGEKVDLDTTFIMASCTKLMTSIAAMQCVERGLLSLDEDISRILPELKDVQIIKEAEPGKEIVYQKSQTALTLRHLLTHTSGLGYDMLDPRYHAWRASRGESPGLWAIPILSRISTPILFEPGTSWVYGTSLDWVGVAVARLNNITLEAFMEANIWTPLGIKDITFHQEAKPAVKSNLVKMTVRKGIPNQGFPIPMMPVDTGEGVEFTDETLYDDPTADEYGGAGGIGSAVEYMKILDSLLVSDGKLLRSETIDEMFKPQLSSDVAEAMQKNVDQPMYKDGLGNPPSGTRLNHGLGGMIMMENIETGRNKGTMAWSGLPNLLWSIDKEKRLNLMYASNVLPFGDYKSGEMQRLFETEMYKRFEEMSGLALGDMAALGSNFSWEFLGTKSLPEQIFSHVSVIQGIYVNGRIYKFHVVCIPHRLALQLGPFEGRVKEASGGILAYESVTIDNQQFLPVGLYERARIAPYVHVGGESLIACRTETRSLSAHVRWLGNPVDSISRDS